MFVNAVAPVMVAILYTDRVLLVPRTKSAKVQRDHDCRRGRCVSQWRLRDMGIRIYGGRHVLRVSRAPLT